MESDLFKTLLQLWGGSFFLVNKFGLSRKERTSGETRRMWTILSWLAYLVGLPAWLVIFVRGDNWLVLTVETVCIVPIILIIYGAAKRYKEEDPEWTNWLARVALVVGIVFSAYKLNGFSSLTQLLELGSDLGVVVGTYQLRRGRLSGYIWFLIMNASCGLLMLVENHYIMATQQLISLAFIMDAYRIKRARSSGGS